jgi:formamidopyrimidine-DNA glycosylase
MPELPELTVVQEVLHRHILGQTITSAEVIPPGGPIVVRDLTGAGFASALAGARFESIIRRGKFLTFYSAVIDARPPFDTEGERRQTGMCVFRRAVS